MQRYKKNVNREQSKVKNFICSNLSCNFQMPKIWYRWQMAVYLGRHNFIELKTIVIKLLYIIYILYIVKFLLKDY